MLVLVGMDAQPFALHLVSQTAVSHNLHHRRHPVPYPYPCPCPYHNRYLAHSQDPPDNLDARDHLECPVAVDFPDHPDVWDLWDR